MGVGRRASLPAASARHHFALPAAGRPGGAAAACAVLGQPHAGDAGPLHAAGAGFPHRSVSGHRPACGQGFHGGQPARCADRRRAYLCRHHTGAAPRSGTPAGGAHSRGYRTGIRAGAVQRAGRPRSAARPQRPQPGCAAHSGATRVDRGTPRCPGDARPGQPARRGRARARLVHCRRNPARRRDHNAGTAAGAVANALRRIRVRSLFETAAAAGGRHDELLPVAPSGPARAGQRSADVGDSARAAPQRHHRNGPDAVDRGAGDPRRPGVRGALQHRGRICAG